MAVHQKTYDVLFKELGTESKNLAYFYFIRGVVIAKLTKKEI